MSNIINENFRTADESVEVVELPQGNIWIFIKDGECIIFKSLDNFIDYVCLGISVERKYCKEDDLMHIYETSKSFYDIDILATN